MRLVTNVISLFPERSDGFNGVERRYFVDDPISEIPRSFGEVTRKWKVPSDRWTPEKLKRGAKNLERTKKEEAQAWRNNLPSTYSTSTNLNISCINPTIGQKPGRS
jgi:hypothetical protein